MNIPNLLSLSRIFLIPVFLYFLFRPEVHMKIWALVIFSIASLTDLFDGWSARKLNLETELGKFLDPIADKILVIATLAGFVMLDPLIPFWMVLVIVSRDILITLMRYIAIYKGSSIRTSRFGKVKTAFQMISFVIIIMIFIVRSHGVEVYSEYATSSPIKLWSVCKITVSDYPDKFLVVAPYWLMLMVTILTALSGIRYLIFNGSLLLPPYHKKEEK
jgi:cardiolipin synthase